VEWAEAWASKPISKPFLLKPVSFKEAGFFYGEKINRKAGKPQSRRVNASNDKTKNFANFPSLRLKKEQNRKVAEFAKIVYI